MLASQGRLSRKLTPVWGGAYICAPRLGGRKIDFAQWRWVAGRSARISCCPSFPTDGDPTAAGIVWPTPRVPNSPPPTPHKPRRLAQRARRLHIALTHLVGGHISQPAKLGLFPAISATVFATGCC